MHALNPAFRPTQLEMYPIIVPVTHGGIVEPVARTLPSPVKKPPGLVALEQLLQLDVDDELDEQFGFGFPLNDFEWTADQVLQVQELLLKHHSHLLRDERTTRETWLEIILWLIAPFEMAERCSPFSLQACCTAFGADFETVREQIVEWVAARIRPPGPVKAGSFQAHCELRSINPDGLRKRLIRSFAPSLLKTLR